MSVTRRCARSSIGAQYENSVCLQNREQVEWPMLCRFNSSMTIKEMTAVIDLCHAFGADKGVVWSRTSLGRLEYEVDPETGEIERLP